MAALEIKKEDFNRFGAALLFLVGKAVRLEDFGCALSITGPNGDQLLVDELRNASAIDENGILLPGKEKGTCKKFPFPSKMDALCMEIRMTAV